ncbi:MAG: hypothetical protein FJ119_08915 [Deltaproteobacteria bacterium]|nr:hypothetical protein [Deltaproteobacteria bacterium]
MSTDKEKTIVYFADKGPSNTDRTIACALACCRDQSIAKIVVATSSGETALKVREATGPAIEVIAVTYGAGSRFVEEVAAFNANRTRLEAAGIRIVRGIHALSATERTFENKYAAKLIPLNLVSDSLRMLGQGMKVCVEVAIMAAEHGFITPAEDVVVIGGSGAGADTAVVLKPAYAAAMFDLRIRQILCKPLG